MLLSNEEAAASNMGEAISLAGTEHIITLVADNDLRSLLLLRPLCEKCLFNKFAAAFNLLFTSLLLISLGEGSIRFSIDVSMSPSLHRTCLVGVEFPDDVDCGKDFQRWYFFRLYSNWHIMEMLIQMVDTRKAIVTMSTHGSWGKSASISSLGLMESDAAIVCSISAKRATDTLLIGNAEDLL